VSNFYRDNDDILFHIKHSDLSRIIQFKEGDFSEKALYPHAPEDVEDAMDNYDKVLDIVGEIAGEFVAPRAPDVDREEAQWVNGEVHYAKGTMESIERLKRADLMGFTLPRKYDGINMPKTVYTIAIEIISRADASLMTIFGLQAIGDTIYRFGSEDQRQRYLPLFSNGQVLGSMALTEPDAGSDLQAVMLAARQKSDGKWYLNGVKRFITNGCADISLVLARSEEGISGSRGLSLFIYRRDKNMRIRRIEHKLGIHGSPTCELQFNDAPAELLGERKLGLIKYTSSLMNGARIAVAAQAIGIAEASYREADSYAKHRIQFKKPIRQITAIWEMLTNMKVAIEAGRTLLYETSRIVDLKEGFEEAIARRPDQNVDLQENLQRYTRYAALFTPLVKLYATEMGNKVCYDALQIHGGTGYMKEFNVERHFRDIRVTNIYEGTSQLQVAAAIGGIITGVVFARLGDYENSYDFSPVAEQFEKAQVLRTHLETAVSHVKERGDKMYQEYHARRLVEMGVDAVLSYLLCVDALYSERKKKVAQFFISQALPRCKAILDCILSDDKSTIQFHREVLKPERDLSICRGSS